MKFGTVLWKERTKKERKKKRKKERKKERIVGQARVSS